MSKGKGQGGGTDGRTEERKTRFMREESKKRGIELARKKEGRKEGRKEERKEGR